MEAKVCVRQLHKPVVLDLIQLESRLENVDLVITGEGRIDNQSLCGKVPVGIAKRIKSVGNIPVIAIVGSIAADTDSIYNCGIDGVITIVNGPMKLETAVSQAQQLTQDAVKRMISLMQLGKNI
jgi:glycerate kinase